MDHFVKLSHWPTKLVIPNEYADAVILDPEHRRLGFHGYMRKADFDALATASREPVYLDALQELFAHSTFEGKASKSRVWLRWGLVIVAVALAATFYLTIFHRG